MAWRGATLGGHVVGLPYAALKGRGAADARAAPTHECLDQGALAICLVADDQDRGRIEGLLKVCGHSVSGGQLLGPSRGDAYTPDGRATEWSVSDTAAVRTLSEEVELLKRRVERLIRIGLVQPHADDAVTQQG